MSTWGAIEPVDSPQARLRLDFGLRSAILAFNEWAVPGLGGAFFVRQLSWGSLGLLLAEEMNQPAMGAKIAEGLEALASWTVIKEGNPGKDDRVQGKRKFKDVTELSFAAVSEHGAYVTVPFRRATTAALSGLGFCVTAEARFNSLQLTAAGIQLAQAALNHGKAGEALRNWINNPSKPRQKVYENIKFSLLPEHVSGEELDIVRTQLLADARRARLASLLVQDDVMPSLQKSSGQLELMNKISDPVHRAQLDACFAFERLRASALQAAQKLADMIHSEQRSWVSLANSQEVQAAFETLAAHSATLSAKLARLSDVPAEITAFCGEQGSGVPLQTRIKTLSTRVPLVFSVLQGGLGRGLGYIDKLVQDEGGESTENQEPDYSTVPRPLARLKRLYHEVMQGAEHAA